MTRQANVTDRSHTAWPVLRPTACLLLEDGTRFYGNGTGATGTRIGEVCFNTAMTGYQEILTDSSYAGQFVVFTYPHIGNVGVNDEDLETLNEHAGTTALACISATDITSPSNWRSQYPFPQWLAEKNIIGMHGLDTRALTIHIRQYGMMNAAICHQPDGTFNEAALADAICKWPGIDGQDYARDAGIGSEQGWDESVWSWSNGFGSLGKGEFHIAVIDYGCKRNILRLLVNQDCRLTIVPPDTPASRILALRPDGIFLSNGPGDPAATGVYAMPILRELIPSEIPIFGICLGHQLLGLALGGRTIKMKQGHHGANHPVLDRTTGAIEITSMNHGFAIDGDSLPDHIIQSHISLFDGTNCGLQDTAQPLFSVQFHPEASPGPHDSHYLMKRVVDMVRKRSLG